MVIEGMFFFTRRLCLFQLCVSASLSLCLAGCGGDSDEDAYQAAKAADAAAKTAPTPPTPEGTIGISDLSPLVFQRRVTLVDCRYQSVWAEGHLPGAVWAGVGIHNLLARIPKDPNRLIVVYGTDKDDPNPAQVEDQLRSAGRTRIVRYVGGYTDWLDHNARIEITGSTP